MSNSPTTMREFELIRELRRTVGLFDGAMPISPKAAWDEAIRRVVRLQQLHDELLDALQKVDRRFTANSLITDPYDQSGVLPELTGFQT